MSCVGCVIVRLLALISTIRVVAFVYVPPKLSSGSLRELDREPLFSDAATVVIDEALLPCLAFPGLRCVICTSLLPSAAFGGGGGSSSSMSGCALP